MVMRPRSKAMPEASVDRTVRSARARTKVLFPAADGPATTTLTGSIPLFVGRSGRRLDRSGRLAPAGKGGPMAKRRPLRPDDLYLWRAVSDPRLSPAGQRLAVVM